MDARKDFNGDQGEAVTNKQPGVAVAPAANATDTSGTTPTEPVSQAYGATEPTTTRKPLEPVVDLTVHRTNTSQADLDEEAIVLMQTIRETISNTNTLMGYLSTKPGVFEPFENEVAMLDATTGYLISILGPSAAARATPTREQRLRRMEIQTRQDEAIKKLRRLPMREKGGEVACESLPIAVALPSEFVPNPERSESLSYRDSLSPRERARRLVDGVGPGSEIAGYSHERRMEAAKMRMGMRPLRLPVEQQSIITAEAEQVKVARLLAEESRRSEPFDIDSSASLNTYWRQQMAKGRLSQGDSGSGDEKQAEPEEKAKPEQKAELEVDDSGLDGVGWLYEVD